MTAKVPDIIAEFGRDVARLRAELARMRSRGAAREECVAYTDAEMRRMNARYSEAIAEVRARRKPRQ